MTDDDLSLLSEQFAFFSKFLPSLYRRSPDGTSVDVTNDPVDFAEFLHNVIEFGAGARTYAAHTVGYDKRWDGIVLEWERYVSPVIDFWCIILGRTIKNYFNDEVRRPEMEEGEPINAGARFLADCLKLIDGRNYTHERLMRLLDSRKEPKP